jgi:phosphoribosylformylglycinamidine synthase
LVGLAEMAMALGIGAEVDAAPSDIPAHAHWFGEDQARYLVTVSRDKVGAVLERAKAANVPVWAIGRTGGDTLTVAGERPILVTILRERFESWLPAYMAGKL